MVFLRIHQQRWWGQSAHHQLRLLRFGWSNPNSYSTIACLTIHTRKWVDVTRILQFSWEFKGDPRPASHPPQRNKALLEQVACWSGIPIHWTQINPFIYWGAAGCCGAAVSPVAVTDTTGGHVPLWWADSSKWARICTDCLRDLFKVKLRMEVDMWYIQ